MNPIQITLAALMEQGFYAPQALQMQKGSDFMCNAIQNASNPVEEIDYLPVWNQPVGGAELGEVQAAIDEYMMKLATDYGVTFSLEEGSMSLVELMCRIIDVDDHEYDREAAAKGHGYCYLAEMIYHDWDHRPRSHYEIQQLFDKAEYNYPHY